MSERFTAAQGRKLISRVSAEELGKVTHLVIDSEQRQIVSLVIGKRRSAQVVSWEHVSAFGADAVIIDDESAVHDPSDPQEQAAAKGQLEVLGRLALSDVGTELGKVDDIVFDPESGALEAVVIGKDEQPAAALLGAGSYAVILEDAELITPDGHHD